MRIASFGAVADIVGTRIRVAWSFLPEAAETLADIPPVQVRRKTRDFEYPAPVGGLDPFLVYDGSAFPPAPGPGVTVVDLPGWETLENGLRTVVGVVSVAANAAGPPVELLRCTTSTGYDPAGTPVERRVEILDLGPPPAGLTPGTTYYYQIFCPAIAGSTDRELAPYRATATATARYGLDRTLYELLPNIYRRFDVIRRAEIPGAEAVLEAAPNAGQLRRFCDIFGRTLDLMRSSAEGLLNLRDIDSVDYRFLPLLAHWIGWDLAFEGSIPLRRNECKSAVRLYRGVGTPRAIRAIVNRYTGWYTQVAEYAQSISRANVAPHLNLWAAAEAGGEWIGTDEAALVLGFGTGNDQAVGGPGMPAVLTGSSGEPFALRPGMEIAVSVQNLAPEIVRFGPADFATIGAATASEVCTAVSRAASGFTAVPDAGGRIELRSTVAGPHAVLRVSRSSSSLMTLEGAPRGRLSAFVDGHSRLRLFYQATDPISQDNTDRNPARIRLKTLAYGRWGNSHLLADAPQGDPAAAELPDGRLCLAWIENPNSAASRLRAVRGTAAIPQPAMLWGQQRGPFAIVPGMRLALRGSWAGTDTVAFLPASFADPLHATPAEVAAEMNAHLVHAAADAQPNGTLRLRSLDTGIDARLEIDLSQSCAIQGLGFDSRSAPAHGTWDDRVAWGLPDEVTSPGRHADLAALVDQAGGLRLFWAVHHDGLWRIASLRWDERAWIATGAGASIRQAAGGWITYTTADGLASDDVRALAVDADGSAWFATAGGVSLRRATGAWTTFTTADGLASDDVRGLALAPDGSAWFATAAGVSVRSAFGIWATFTTADALASDDVRAVALTSDGSAWFATAGGASVRRANGAWMTFTTAGGLASDDVRGLALAPDGTAWFATAAGVGVRHADGTWSTYAVAQGLASDDVRAVALAADGTAWMATAAGASLRRADGSWSTFTAGSTAGGLASNDVRGVTPAADGTIWFATSLGASLRELAGTWQTFRAAGGGGLASDDVRAVHGPWSALRELAAAATAGAHRQPYALLDAAGRIWLLWSCREGKGTPEDAWTLRRRVFDPATATWDPEAALLPPSGTAADQEPGAILLPGGDLRVFFRSNRSGGPDVWSVTVNSGGVVSGPALAVPGPAADCSPAPVWMGGGALWLLYRSDRSVPLAQVDGAGNGASARPGLNGSRPTTRVPDSGTLRHFAGATSAMPTDLARINRRAQWDDPLTYTALDPRGERVLREDELYTRGTIGLYVSSTDSGLPLSEENVGRLRQLLERFLPINLRAVVRLVSPGYLETIYAAGADIGESYLDQYPYAELYAGLADSAAAALPDWTLLHSNIVTDVSVDPADPTTWRRRTYFPPP